jgi:hypothetical protein
MKGLTMLLLDDVVTSYPKAGDYWTKLPRLVTLRPFVVFHAASVRRFHNAYISWKEFGGYSLAPVDLPTT